MTKNNISKISLSPVLGAIRLYQKYISPMTAPRCRFTPTCSTYTLEAIEAHGHLKGIFYGVKRICKCHPWHAGGYDPVPEKRSEKQNPSMTP